MRTHLVDSRIVKSYSRINISLTVNLLPVMFRLLQKYHKDLLVLNDMTTLSAFMGDYAFVTTYDPSPIKLCFRINPSGVFDLENPTAIPSYSLQQFKDMLLEDNNCIIHFGTLSSTDSIHNGVYAIFVEV